MFLPSLHKVLSACIFASYAHRSRMVNHGRIKPVAIISALIIMIAALLYTALNRSHEAAPAAPMHQSR